MLATYEHARMRKEVLHQVATKMGRQFETI